MLTHHRLPELTELLRLQQDAPDVRTEVEEIRGYYISARYPNARENHGTTPTERLNGDHAARAVGAAERAVQTLRAFCSDEY
jgi:HEPN domain-containing protein